MTDSTPASIGPAAAPLRSAGRASVGRYDPKIHDTLFEAVDAETAEHGFLTASLDDAINWARAGTIAR